LKSKENVLNYANRSKTSKHWPKTEFTVKKSSKQQSDMPKTAQENSQYR
jgi:hypothetical protein